MKILAIETSCDETACAVLEAHAVKAVVDFSILSNQISSQVKIHAPFGGVVPNLAKREHQKNLPILLERALKESKTKKPDVLAVTYGPGLEPALWVGINFAKELSRKWGVPLIPVNHLEGHIYSAFMRNFKFSISNFEFFPLLTLIVSGGHTELVLTRKHLDYKILGETKDDAAGEAFDKVARMLGLGYPGGPLLAKIANRLKAQNSKFKVSLPRPMLHSGDLYFSFSGLKTAVLYLLEELRPRYSMKDIRARVASEFQNAVVEVLVRKTLGAVKKHYPKTVTIGGGVAANKMLRKELGRSLQKLPFEVHYLAPDLVFTGDNAAMIAVPAYFRFKAKKFRQNSESLKARGGLKLSKTSQNWDTEKYARRV